MKKEAKLKYINTTLSKLVNAAIILSLNVSIVWAGLPGLPGLPSPPDLPKPPGLPARPVCRLLRLHPFLLYCPRPLASANPIKEKEMGVR